MNRRNALIGIAACGAAPYMSGLQAQMQTWPSRPIRLVVPFPPGGLIDAMAKLVAPVMSKELGREVMLDHKPGETGGVAAAEVARATADGYTLLMASAPLTISPAIYRTLPYKPEDISVISLLGRVPQALFVSSKSSIRSVADLVALAKQKPGAVNLGSNGLGTTGHMCGELFQMTANVRCKHLPQKGGAAAVAALAAGEIDVAFGDLPPILPQIRSGAITALAVTTRTRSRALPQVTTMREALQSDFDATALFGIAGPASLPLAIRARLENSLEKVMRDQQVIAAMQKDGIDVAFLKDPMASAFMAFDTTRWKRVAQYANIKL